MSLLLLAENFRKSNIHSNDHLSHVDRVNVIEYTWSTIYSGTLAPEENVSNYVSF
jgi:hypothetical protein